MKITLLQTGKTTDKHISELVDLYSNRIKKYTGFEIITIPDVKNTKNMPVQEQKAKEATKIIQSVTDDDYIILLDERGKELRTLEFSGTLEKMFFLPKKGSFLLLVVPGASRRRFIKGPIIKCLCQR